VEVLELDDIGMGKAMQIDVLRFPSLTTGTRREWLPTGLQRDEYMLFRR